MSFFRCYPPVFLKQNLSLLGYSTSTEAKRYNFNGFEGRDFPDFVLRTRERLWGLSAVCACAGHAICSLCFLLQEMNALMAAVS